MSRVVGTPKLHRHLLTRYLFSSLILSFLFLSLVKPRAIRSMANESTSAEPSPLTVDPTEEKEKEKELPISSTTMNEDASPRSRSFRQRSMAHSNGDFSDSASVSPFDVENGGMRTSQYMAKLELLMGRVESTTGLS